MELFLAMVQYSEIAAISSLQTRKMRPRDELTDGITITILPPSDFY